MTELLHLGCGTNIIDHAHNVDQIGHNGVDEVIDLDVTPWPWPDNSFSKILAEHVIEHIEDVESVLTEAGRVLKPDGVLEIAVPIGHDAYVDPDHKHIWGFETPDMYCGDRAWDSDVGLSVEDKSVKLWPHAPGLLGYAWGGLLKLLQKRYNPGRWAFDLPASSGEFRVVFRNT